MFEHTVALMDRLYVKLDEENALGFQRDLAQEARKRLRQLDHLLKAVRHCEQQEHSVTKGVFDACRRHSEHVGLQPANSEPASPPQDTKYTEAKMQLLLSSQFEMELLTECFYYIAGRLRTILTSKLNPIPRLHSFECVGARDVRNKLLEHADGKQSEVFIQSFGWGKENGPVLKAARYSGQETAFPDKGLYVNAQEIKDNLERLLNRMLSEPD